MSRSLNAAGPTSRDLVVTSSPLNGAVAGQQPDLIVWNGQTYIVTIVNDYQANGYTRAICKLTDYQDQPNV